MSPTFDHDKLQVYQAAIQFVGWADRILQQAPKSAAIYGQLDRAATSVPLNIAEGNGKFTSTDRCRFFDIARGSALECAACLDVLLARRWIAAQDLAEGKAMLAGLVSMQVGLIKANSTTRACELPEEYGVGAGESKITIKSKMQD